MKSIFYSNAAWRESRPKAGFRGGQVGFVKKKVTFFRGQIFAVHFIVSVRKRVSIPELLQHKNPSQGCTVNLRQPSAKQRVKTKMTLFHGQIFAFQSPFKTLARHSCVLICRTFTAQKSITKAKVTKIGSYHRLNIANGFPRPLSRGSKQ